MRRTWIALIALVSTTAVLGAQSPKAPAHDLTGVWYMRNPPGMNRPFTNFTFTDPKTDQPSLTPWGEARFKEARDSNGGSYTLDQTNDPVLTKCYPPGVPRVYFHPYPFEFVHTPKYTLQLYEYDHTVRRIYTDGRPLPKDPDLWWMGHSVGRWDGDTTLVVETSGFNDKTWHLLLRAPPRLGDRRNLVRRRLSCLRARREIATTCVCGSVPLWLEVTWGRRERGRGR
jgi:hypothetical protein